MEKLINFCRDNSIEFHMYANTNYITFKFYRGRDVRTFLERIEWDEYTKMVISNDLDILYEHLILNASKSFKIA